MGNLGGAVGGLACPPTGCGLEADAQPPAIGLTNHHLAKGAAQNLDGVLRKLMGWGEAAAHTGVATPAQRVGVIADLDREPLYHFI